MAFSLLVSTSGNAASDPANTAVTPAIDTTGADLIVVFGASIFGYATLTDSESNTWTSLTGQNHIGFYFGRIYYCVTPITSATHTFTYATTSFFPSLCVQAWSGVAASPFDQENGATYGQFPDQPVVPGSVTPSEDDELLVTGLSWGNAGADTVIGINSGFTVSDDEQMLTGQNGGAAMAYKVQTSAGAENPEWSSTQNISNITTAIATFKAAPSGGLRRFFLT